MPSNRARPTEVIVGVGATLRTVTVVWESRNPPSLSKTRPWTGYAPLSAEVNGWAAAAPAAA